jgi:hypothetical protein
MNPRNTRRYRFLPCLFLLSACAGETGTDTLPQSDTQQSDTQQSEADPKVEKLAAAMAELPGRLVVTRSVGVSFDEQTRREMRDADKVIHVFSDGTVQGYVHFSQQVPGQEGPVRYVKEFGGDIVIAPSEKLADYLLQREAKKEGTHSAQGVGLAIGHGGVWADSTIAYEIDSNFFSNSSELNTLRLAIGSWNNAVDAWGTRIRPRFVPRYPGDGRSYVHFFRSTDNTICGRSRVGNNSNIFTNWWSHNVDIVCVNTDTIHHEMGHTAGLYHEQQRCNRDLFVHVTEGGIDCERRCGGDAVDYVQYNYRSVMHYPYGTCGMSQITPASSNYRGSPWDAGWATQLDTQDVQSLNEMYSSRRALPLVGAGIYYNLLPDHVPTRAVGVPGASPNDNVQLLIWDRGAPDHQWEFRPDSHGFFEIRNRVTGKCMDVYGWSTSDGGRVVQWSCHGGDNQKWILAPSSGNSGTFDIVNKLSLKSLDVTGVGTANGTPMQQWGYTGGGNQRFRLLRVY